jgi:hypothetical protein
MMALSPDSIALQPVAPMNPASDGVAVTNVVTAELFPDEGVSALYNPAWDAATIRWFFRSITEPHPAWKEQVWIDLITDITQRITIPVPSNTEEFIATLFALPLSSSRDACILWGLVSDTTNPALSDFLFSFSTNHFGESYSRPGWSDSVDRTTFSLWPMRGLGTPDLLDRLNRFMDDGVKSADRRFASPRWWSLDPNRYPVEARQWLLEYWRPEIQHYMFERWYYSERPEALSVLDEFLRRAELLPWSDPLWRIDRWQPEERRHIKRLLLEEYRNKRNEFAKLYARWIEDDKRMPLHWGCYTDDYWDDYRKEPEPIRRDYQRTVGNTAYP